MASSILPKKERKYIICVGCGWDLQKNYETKKKYRHFRSNSVDPEQETIPEDITTYTLYNEKKNSSDFHLYK